ncbi:MAG: hypothetical protein GXC76_04740 [Rhodanobacteraceae bacterium]|jgi:hypothetical protein|nr:hypothetical protein [Rhodanobacteraceae bacterium]
MLHAPLLALSLAAAAPDPAAAALIAAERGFAADAQRLGVRTAFLTHFDAESWVFRPTPVAALPALARDPDDGHQLIWTPQRVGVAASGDLGFSTGPWSAHHAGQAQMAHGQFLSIWKRGNNGIWRVQVDAGIPHPATSTPLAPPVVMSMAAPAAPDGADHAQREDALARRDAALHEALAAQPATSPLPRFADAAIHVLRDGQAPADGAAALALVANDPPGLGRGPRRALGMAASGDLGYTIGGAADCTGCGSYLRIWRWADGDWKLLVDLSTP